MKKNAALLLFGVAGLYQSALAQSTEADSSASAQTKEEAPPATTTTGDESQDPTIENTDDSTDETVGEEEPLLPLEDVEEEVIEWVDVPAEQGPIESQAISLEGWSGIDAARCKVL